MSRYGRVGHLYHDSSISDACTVLDAKEHLRMREINAREQRFLSKHIDIMDRAKDISQKARDWERMRIRRQIRKLYDKTVSLEGDVNGESTIHESDCSISGSCNHSKADVCFGTLGSLKLEQIRREIEESDSSGVRQRGNRVLRSLLKTYNRSNARRHESPFQLNKSQADVLDKARIVLKGTEWEADVNTTLTKLNSSPVENLELDSVHPTIGSASNTSHSAATNKSGSETYMDTHGQQPPSLRSSCPVLPKLSSQGHSFGRKQRSSKPNLVTITAKYRKSRMKYM